jgi:hypothetical protein
MQLDPPTNKLDSSSVPQFVIVFFVIVSPETFDWTSIPSS